MLLLRIKFLKFLSLFFCQVLRRLTAMVDVARIVKTSWIYTGTADRSHRDDDKGSLGASTALAWLGGPEELQSDVAPDLKELVCSGVPTPDAAIESKRLPDMASKALGSAQSTQRLVSNRPPGIWFVDQRGPQLLDPLELLTTCDSRNHDIAALDPELSSNSFRKSNRRCPRCGHEYRSTATTALEGVPYFAKVYFHGGDIKPCWIPFQSDEFEPIVCS